MSDQKKKELPFAAAATPAALVARCARRGLRLMSTSESFEDSGLDFRVAPAIDEHGARYIVREPRRADVVDGVRREARVLGHVAPYVPCAVPAWEVADDDVIAYRRLPGEPVILVTAEGPVWRFGPSDLPQRFVDDVAAFLVGLWRAPVHDDVPKKTGERAEIADAIETAAPLLDAPDWLRAQWQRFVDDDALWTADVVMSHGDLHPGHLLVDDDAHLVGVLDWTEGKHSDRSVDLAYFYGCFGASSFSSLRDALVKNHGVVIDEKEQKKARLRWSVFPATSTMWALKAGNTDVLAFTKAQVAAMTPDEN